MAWAAFGKSMPVETVRIVQVRISRRPWPQQPADHRFGRPSVSSDAQGLDHCVRHVGHPFRDRGVRATLPGTWPTGHGSGTLPRSGDLSDKSRITGDRYLGFGESPGVGFPGLLGGHEGGGEPTSITVASQSGAATDNASRQARTDSPANSRGLRSRTALITWVESVRCRPPASRRSLIWDRSRASRVTWSNTASPSGNGTLGPGQGHRGVGSGRPGRPGARWWPRWRRCR